MSTPKRAKKKKRGGGSADLAKPVAEAGGWLLTSPHLLVSFASIGIAVATLCYPNPMLGVAFVASLIGLLLLIISEIRLLVVTFRLNAGLGCLLILGNVASFWFGLTGQVELSGAINVGSFLIILLLVINNWDEFRSAVLGWAASLLLAVIPLIAIFYNALPQAREAARRDEARRLAAEANPIPPNRPVNLEPKPIANRPVAVAPIQNDIAIVQNPVRPAPPPIEPPQKPVNQAPPMQAAPAAPAKQPSVASTHLLTFRVQEFAEQDDPLAAAREALDGFASVNLTDLAFDRRSAELRIGLTKNSVDAKPIQRSLENVGFRFRPGSNITAKPVIRNTPANPGF